MTALAPAPVPSVKNALHVIYPYRWQGDWVFDDDRVGLSREPFVFGADVALNILAGFLNEKNPPSRFKVIFSEHELPRHHFILKLFEDNRSAGAIYTYMQTGHLWLCPALLHYFPAAPKQIYVWGMEMDHDAS